MYMTTHKDETITHNMQNYSDIISEEIDSTHKVSEDAYVYESSRPHLHTFSVEVDSHGRTDIDWGIIQYQANCYAQSLIDAENEDRKKFYHHYEKWSNETGPLSDRYEIMHHQDYLEIVKMGERAVPYILKEIDNDSGYLYWALNDIYPNIQIKRIPAEEAIKEWKRTLRKS